MEDLTGKQLGVYRVVAPLGEGGMAAVFKAYQAGMDRYVALKILPRYFASDPQFVARFEQEAKVLARLLHPHILPVHDYGESDGYTYIAMPFVESGTLADLLDDQPLPLVHIRRIVTQVGDALDYAHSQGVIHRDVKPSNVLVDQRGNCLLTDFGIAKMVEGSVYLTRTGGIVGTPAYMSPEQIQGHGLDGRSDVYSLGIVLYEMATGRPPYRAETPPAIFVKHLHDPLPPPSSLNSELPEPVERVILKSLAKNREERYASAGEMVRALQAAIPESTVAKGIPGEKVPAIVVEKVTVGEPDLEEAETAGTEVLGRPAEPPVPEPVPPIKDKEAVAAPTPGDQLESLLSGVLEGPLAGILESLPSGLDTQRVRHVLTQPITLVILAIVAGLVILGLIALLAPRPVVGVLDTRLAFTSNRDGNPDIYLMDDEGEIIRFTRHAAPDDSPSWSPNKRRIAFASHRNGNWEIYWMGADGDELTRVTHNPAADTEPAWSPNGDYIAFTSDRDGKREIYLAGPDGLSRVTHTPGDSESWAPAWGPNNAILFTSDRDGKPEIYRTSQAGEIVRITRTPGDAGSWSPAWGWGGNYTAFVSNRDGPQDVYTLSEGGVLSRISHSPNGRGSGQPAPSASGQFIAFTSDRAGRQDIYTTTEEGTRQLTHTPGDGESWSPAW